MPLGLEAGGDVPAGLCGKGAVGYQAQFVCLAQGEGFGFRGCGDIVEERVLVWGQGNGGVGFKGDPEVAGAKGSNECFPMGVDEGFASGQDNGTDAEGGGFLQKRFEPDLAPRPMVGIAPGTG